MNRLIALAIPPGEDFLKELQLAWSEGDAVLPVDPRLPKAAQKSLLEVAAPSLIVETPGHREQLKYLTNGEARPIEPGDALVVPTSGTTSEPKGVVLTHEAIAASAKMTSNYLAVDQNDHWLCCLPTAHIGGLAVITRALLTNTQLTVLPRFDANEVEIAAKSGCTLVSLVTTALQRINPSLFRKVLLGAGPPPEQLPSNVVTTYGMTETASGVVYNGYPLEQVEIRISPSQEIQLKSPTLFRAYRTPFADLDVKKDGWFSTGDAGSLDDQSKLTVYGRIDEVINSGGEKIWPAVIENALTNLLLPGFEKITGAYVFGEPDPEWGKRVVATIEISSRDSTPPTYDTIKEALREVLPSYAIPKRIEFVDQLPRTASGKIKRS